MNSQRESKREEREDKERKKSRANREILLRWMIAAFLFCLFGTMMQIIAPPFQDIAAVMGIVSLY